MRPGEKLVFRWEHCQNGVRILRVYGDTPCPILPPTVVGLPVVELGAYCFAESDKYGNTGILTAPAAAATHAIGGKFVTDITLPASISVLNSAAFYDCRALSHLAFGPGITGVGSDIFTNCIALTDLDMDCVPTAPTGLQKLLGAISADITVHITQNGAELARLFYAEYAELLDENTPAHIFNHSIDGEGYRYRQCFNNGVLNFSEYDAAFPLAAITEPPSKLCQLALGRLQYPFALTAKAEAVYRRYLAAHETDAAALALHTRDGALLGFLCRAKLLTPGAVKSAAGQAAAAGWSEGAALLLATAPRREPKHYDFSDI